MRNARKTALPDETPWGSKRPKKLRQSGYSGARKGKLPRGKRSNALIYNTRGGDTPRKSLVMGNRARDGDVKQLYALMYA